MDISRKLGVLVFFAVPAIIGGGIMFHFFQSYIPITIFELVLILTGVAIINK